MESKLEKSCSLFDHKCFIITDITKITWAIRHALSVDEKSTKEKECTTEVD
jgi:hypothetical protein